MSAVAMARRAAHENGGQPAAKSATGHWNGALHGLLHVLLTADRVRASASRGERKGSVSRAQGGEGDMVYSAFASERVRYGTQKLYALVKESGGHLPKAPSGRAPDDEVIAVCAHTPIDEWPDDGMRIASLVAKLCAGDSEAQTTLRQLRVDQIPPWLGGVLQWLDTGCSSAFGPVETARLVESDSLFAGHRVLGALRLSCTRAEWDDPTQVSQLANALRSCQLLTSLELVNLSCRAFTEHMARHGLPATLREVCIHNLRHMEPGWLGGVQAGAPNIELLVLRKVALSHQCAMGIGLMHSLKSLRLYDCTGTDREFFSFLFKRARFNLFSLRLYNCSGLDDGFFMALTNRMQLAELFVHDCAGVRGDGMVFSRLGLADIRTLHLSKLPNVTPGGLVYLLACVSRLTHLHISQVPALTPALATTFQHVLELCSAGSVVAPVSDLHPVEERQAEGASAAAAPAATRPQEGEPSDPAPAAVAETAR
jgi:hypothetical protein